LIKKYSAKRWKRTIVKSTDLANKTGIAHCAHCEVIPNGVDLDIFYPISRLEARQKLGLNPNRHYIFFAANPSRDEKNFTLAQAAVRRLANKDLELLSMVDIPHSSVALWMNASDVVL